MAVTMMTVLAVVGAAAAQAQSLKWQTVKGFAIADDENPGTGLGMWYIWYLQSDGIQILHDKSEPRHHDGSLRLDSFDAYDQVGVQRVDGAWNYNIKYTGIPFADFTASYALKVVSGEPATYRIQLACSPDDPPTVLTYVGPFPSGEGWHRVTVSGEQTMWTSTRDVGSLTANQPHSRAQFQEQCPGGKITEHGVWLWSAPASMSRVDSVMLDTGTSQADRFVGSRFADSLTGQYLAAMLEVRRNAARGGTTPSLGMRARTT